ncbi:MAG: NAD-dependent epimerase/dehydratase family protein [Bacteroidota bacterium]|nr:NAD-dependent epimerase/dehydratase family protein [Bacteroidota bacterium]
MVINTKTVLVLGGWGLVGSAICRRLMDEKPKRIILTSLKESEATEACRQMQKEYPKAGKNFFVPWWGNIFVRNELKDLNREEVLTNAKLRAKFLDDILEELTLDVLERSALYQLLNKYKPDVVVDCINSATAIAYQDIFQSSRDVMQTLRAQTSGDELREVVERLLCTQYTPQLIRHVQIFYRSMNHAKTNIYVKIGTSGTGGMGLNIPYTHSEEKPSRVLLSKSAVAGAHTLLLFLMGRTPDAPITKEIKPTGAIAWKKIAYGEIAKRGKAIELVDCLPEQGVELKGKFQIRMNNNVAEPTGKRLKSVFIDTGENGIFSRGEFEAIATPGQMEFVTPEEIAEAVIYEIKGGNTGHDIINALDNATLSPTYRAGFMFQGALEKMKQLEKEHHVNSVAFEMLGPPRLSKLLHEANLLKLAYGTVNKVLQTSGKKMSDDLTALIQKENELRSEIISIGIPILLQDGKTLLRGHEVKIPPFRGVNEFPITPQAINGWSHNGWIDLRVSSMEDWKARLVIIKKELDIIAEGDTSSRNFRTPEYWENFNDIDPGKIVGWIFSIEEKGLRMKS